MDPQEFDKFVINLTRKAAPSMLTSQEGFLEDWEIEAIIMSLATVRGDDGFTEEEAVKIIKWCEEQRIGASLVDLVCRGYANVNWKNNECTFQISEAGRIAFEGENDGSSN